MDSCIHCDSAVHPSDRCPSNEIAKRHARSNNEIGISTEERFARVTQQDPAGEQIAGYSFDSTQSLCEILTAFHSRLRSDAEVSVHGLDRMEVWQNGDKRSIRFTSAEIRSGVADADQGLNGDDCTCADRSWFGDRHDSACPRTGRRSWSGKD